jgi:DNA polymerase III epsilon subunit-like protein
MEPKLLYLDVETNGIGKFRPATQRMMQISWIYENNEYNYFINDVESVSPDVPHDISTSFCKERGEDFDNVYNIFHGHLENCDKVIAHNAEFDLGIISHELKVRKHDKYKKYNKILKDLLESDDVICTMKNTTELCKIKFNNGSKGYKYPKLDELYNFLTGENCEEFGQLHDSLVDCKLLKACYEIYLEIHH